MLRYQRLIRANIDPRDDKPKVKLCDLSRQIGIPNTSLYNYVHFNTFPHIDNALKIADYYGESLCSIFSEDDDLTATLVAKVRALPDEQKEQLLRSL